MDNKLDRVLIETLSGRRAWFDGERLEGDHEITSRAYTAIIKGEIVPVKDEYWVAGLSQAGIVAALHAWDPGGITVLEGPGAEDVPKEVTIDYTEVEWA